MATKSHQSQCRDCKYVWYPREKREKCPKCKGTNVAYHSGLGRLLLVLLTLLILGAAGAGAYWKFFLEEPSDNETRTTPAKEEAGLAAPGEPKKGDEAEPDPVPPPAEEEEGPAEKPKSLTDQRTWTSRDGRTLEASLLELEMIEGRYVGHFERPNGERFTYKIGNLSEVDVELVKRIVGRE